MKHNNSLTDDKFAREFGHVNGAKFAGKVINLFKEVFMEKLQRREGSGWQLIQNAPFKEINSFLFADPFFLTGKIGSGCDSRFILKRHGVTSFI